MTGMVIRPFAPADEGAVVALWQACQLTRPWNDPRRDITRKLEVNPELFLVGVLNGRVAATAMAGYEGHRGWVNYLAVRPDCRGRGLGRQMMEAVEECLRARGCPKINLQIRTDNAAALAFYARLGYQTDDAVSMGKRLVEDGPALGK
jgi:ribosomal protein S18 acetylase RimI-like enzyme